jgi:hypothetical protein
VEGGDTRYVLEPAAHGHSATLRYEDSGHPVTRFDKVEKFLPDAKALEQYAGRYSSDELLRDSQFVVEKGQLLGGPWS